MYKFHMKWPFLQDEDNKTKGTLLQAHYNGRCGSHLALARLEHRNWTGDKPIMSFNYIVSDVNPPIFILHPLILLPTKSIT